MLSNVSLNYFNCTIHVYTMMQDMVQTGGVGISPKYLADPSRDHFLIPASHGVPNVEEIHSDASDQDSKKGNQQ